MCLYFHLCSVICLWDSLLYAKTLEINKSKRYMKEKVSSTTKDAPQFIGSEYFHEVYGINVQLALAGDDARFFRVSFQLTVLARI